MKSGDQLYFTGFVRDLTERQQTESRLQELQAELVHISRLTAMGEMASTLAHELNQPLSALANYLQGSRRLLEDREDGNARLVRDALGKAADQALRAGEIIRRLRDFVARGETERRIESVSKLVEEASALSLVGAKEQGVRVRLQFDPRVDLVNQLTPAISPINPVSPGSLPPGVVSRIEQIGDPRIAPPLARTVFTTQDFRTRFHGSPHP